MKKSYNTVAEAIKENRIKISYSQEKLGKTLGYSSGQFVSNWERGESLPPLDRLARMSLLFGLNKEILLQTFLDESIRSKAKEYNKAYEFHLHMDKSN